MAITALPETQPQPPLINPEDFIPIEPPVHTPGVGEAREGATAPTPEIVADMVRKSGDVLDMKKREGVEAGIGKTALFAGGIFGANALLAEGKYILTAAVAYTTLKVGSKLTPIVKRAVTRANRRAIRLVDAFQDISEDIGEEIEFFNTKDGDLALRWYGEYRDPDNHPPKHRKRPDTKRIDTIADIARSTGATQVVVPSPIASRGDGRAIGTPMRESRWLYDNKNLRLKRPRREVSEEQNEAMWVPEFAGRGVVVFDTVDDLDEWKQSIEALESREKGDRLQLCVDRLRQSKNGRRLFARLPEEIDYNNPVHLKGVARAFRIRVERDLHDTVRPMRPQTVTLQDPTHAPGRKIHLHGRIGQSLKPGGVEPDITWQENGHMHASEKLLNLLDRNIQSFDQLETIIHGNDPKKAELATLVLGYREALHLLFKHDAGLMSARVRTPGTASPLQWGNVDIDKFVPQASRQELVTAKRVGAVMLAVAGVLGAGKVAIDQLDLRGSLTGNPALEKTDQAILDGALWTVDRAPRAALEALNLAPTQSESLEDWVRNSASNPELLSTEVGNVGDQRNYPVWNLEAHNGMNTNGLWISDVSAVLRIGEHYSEWDESHIVQADTPVTEGPVELDLPTRPTTQQANGELIHVSRTYQPSNFLEERLPVLEGTEIVAFDIQDPDGESVTVSVQRNASGEVIVRDIYSVDHDFEVGAHTIHYWVTPSQIGHQPIGNVHINNDQADHRVFEDDLPAPTDLSSLWQEELQLETVTLEDQLRYLQGLDYALEPFADGTFEDEADILTDTFEAGAGNCNTINTSLILSNPTTLNAVSGFSNQNDDNILGTREAHMAAIDREGNVVDATPAATDTDTQTYFNEPVDDKPPYVPGIPIPLAAGAAATAAGVFTVLKRKRIREAAQNTPPRVYDNVVRTKHIDTSRLEQIEAIINDLRWNPSTTSPLNTVINDASIAPIDPVAPVERADRLEAIRYLVSDEQSSDALLARLEAAEANGRTDHIDPKTLAQTKRLIKHLRKTSPAKVVLKV